MNAAGGTGDQEAQAGPGGGFEGGGFEGGVPPEGGSVGGPGGGEQVGDFSAVASGGTLVVDAGGDGFDSNGTASITGGTVVVNGPTNNGDARWTSTATSASAAASCSRPAARAWWCPPGATSSQGWISATLPSTIAAGTTVQVVGPDGALVSSKAIACVVFSSSAVTSGKQYELRTGGTASGGSTGGLAESGDLGGAAAGTTVTAGQAAAGARMPGRR